MSSSQHISPWPRYPKIPIFLDTKESRIIPQNCTEARNTPHIPPITPISAISTNRYYTFASPKPTRTASSFLRPPTTRHFSRPYTPIESSYIASPTSTPNIHPPYRSNATEGLGIAHAPTAVPSITIQSPLSAKSAPTIPSEKKESKPDIAQRIEKRLWKYQSSKHVAARWLLEIISWIISALCMAAIIIMLLICKDKRIPQWDLGLTLNAYIAILSRISSAALVLPVSEALGQLKWSWFQGDAKKMWDFEIFDNASRGPWGSFLLLIRTKCMTLASLGAAVVILALALDPFFQQVVTYPSLWEIQGNSSIPMVTKYEPPTAIVMQKKVPLIQQSRDLQRVAEKFYYENGTQPIPFGNGTRPDIPLSCPTSNCTWPVYDTLAVCSACTDVSELLTYACLPISVEWASNMTQEYTTPNVTACGYFLNASSESPVFMSGYTIDPVNLTAGEAMVMRTLPLVSNPGRKPIYGGSINFKHVRNPLLDFLIVRNSNDTSAVYRNETPSAHECVLHWCVKSLKSSYFWAKYEEEEVSVVKNTTVGPFPWTTQKVNINGVNGTLTRYLENITIEVQDQNNRTSQYGVSNRTVLQSSFIFDDMFPAVLTVANSSAVPFLRPLSPLSSSRAIVRSLIHNPWLSPNNITRHMERLAMALTYVVRSSESNVMVTGTAYSRETYVTVRWVWLTLPLNLLLLSLVFLVGTILKSSKEMEQVGIWKTSAVATLLYGVPDGLKQKLTDDNAMGTPRTKAKTLRVKLLPKKGWTASASFFPVTPKVRQYQPPPGWI